MGAQLLVGLLLLFLCPGVYKVLLVSSKSLFLQSWVSSVGSVAGLLATSSKRAYAIPRSAAPSAPALAVGHCWPVPLQETLKPSSGSVSVGSLGPGAHPVRTFGGLVWALQASLAGMGFDSKCDFAPLTVLLGLLLCPWTWGIFFWWDPTFSFWWLFTASCNFGG